MSFKIKPRKVKQKARRRGDDAMMIITIKDYDRWVRELSSIGLFPPQEDEAP